MFSKFYFRLDNEIKFKFSYKIVSLAIPLET